MIKASLRILAGTVLGLFAALVVVIGVEAFSSVVHPLPKDFGGTMEEMCRHVERYPSWVLAVCVPLWSAAALIGTWIARRIGDVSAAGIVGLLLLSAVIFNVAKLPYPLWFKVATLLAIPAALIAGGRWAARRTPESRVETG